MRNRVCAFDQHCTRCLAGPSLDISGTRRRAGAGPPPRAGAEVCCSLLSEPSFRFSTRSQLPTPIVCPGVFVSLPVKVGDEPLLETLAFSPSLRRAAAALEVFWSPAMDEVLSAIARTPFPTFSEHEIERSPCRFPPCHSGHGRRRTQERCISAILSRRTNVWIAAPTHR